MKGVGWALRVIVDLVVLNLGTEVPTTKENSETDRGQWWLEENWTKF